ncbi:VOC family protein [Entomohabitans teleogrylli]|uniref:VOC family protein n=1 Tax=Entomohabitans teleogrylli TaxID=1384589 RepID=UPI00073D6DAE|nr:VOC family protein [Entomohabitans teleogrylli]
MQFAWTILYVDDVPQMLDFYHRAFGFEIRYLHDDKNWGELDTGATRLAFCSRKLLAQSGIAAGRSDYRHPTFELAFTTDDVAAALNQALEAGAHTVSGIETAAWGQTLCYVADPEHNLVEICTPLN